MSELEMLRMKEVAVFRVQKFYPPRCPKCLHNFASGGDFGLWLGKGTSAMTAMAQQMESFAELFSATDQSVDDARLYRNRFNADFIVCTHCYNVTMRVKYAEQQVLSQEEAERLVRSLGYQCWTKGVAIGNMARPISTLSPLGWLDLAMLQDEVNAARDSSAAEPDSWQRGDKFAKTLDPALAEWVKRFQHAKESSVAGDRLRTVFGVQWDRLGSDARDFLLTAELLTDDLCARAQDDPTLDFSAPVAVYSKALESEILTKLFVAYKDSGFANKLPESNDKGCARSIKALQDFTAGRRELTLGDMAFCLMNVACKLAGDDANGFSQFLRQRLSSLDSLCQDRDYPARLMRYVQEYRNHAAHVQRLSKAECLAARSMLLEEPIRLLIVLEELLV